MSEKLRLPRGSITIFGIEQHLHRVAGRGNFSTPVSDNELEVETCGRALVQYPLDAEMFLKAQWPEIVDMHLLDRTEDALPIEVEVAQAEFFTERHPGILKKTWIATVPDNIERVYLFEAYLTLNNYSER